MVHGVFLSFRKNDPQLSRERLYQALIARFGRAHIFKAGESIPPGAAYPKTLIQEAGKCEIMLVLIGPAWLGEVGADGAHHIHDRHDWVRREVSEALRRGRRVIPVLMGDGQLLPSPGQLPEDIRVLPNLNCLQVPDTGIELALADVVGKLIWILPALGQLTPEAPEKTEPTAPSAGQTIHGDHGTNVDNSGGTIQAKGRGSVSIGGTHHTTVNTEEEGSAAKVTAMAALVADAIAWCKKARDWAQRHRRIAFSTATALVTAAGVGTFAVLSSPGSNPALSFNPAAGQTSPPPLTQITTLPASTAPTGQPTTAASINAGASPTGPDASVPSGAIPAAGTDILKLQDGNANAWTETFSFGSPVQGTSADQAVVNEAGGCIPSDANVPTETAVIPVSITYDLTSAEPINNFGAGIDTYAANILTVIIYQYADGSYGCYSPSGTDAEIQFNLLSPNSPQSISAWILIYGAYDGKGRPNDSEFAGTSIRGSSNSEAASANVLSATGPDVCGTTLGAVLVTGVKPSDGCDGR